jgi:hypothetical protein
MTRIMAMAMLVKVTREARLVERFSARVMVTSQLNSLLTQCGLTEGANKPESVQPLPKL